MRKNICSIICLVLLLATIVCMFIPCWVYEAKEEMVAASVADYITVPQDHRELTTLFRDYTGAKKLTTSVALPLFVLLFAGIAALVAGLLKLKTLTPAICGVVLGALGLYTCFTNIPLMLSTMYMPLMILYGLMLASGLVQLLLRLKEKLAAL